MQVVGLNLLEGMDYDDVAGMIDDFASKHGVMSGITASIRLQEHKEQTQGVSLVLARIQRISDRGCFTADGGSFGPLTHSGLPRTRLNASSAKGRPPTD